MSHAIHQVLRRGAVGATLAGRATLATAGALAATAALATGVAQAATGPYVSLGDSYTSAPLVPDLTGNPILCGRSTHNYPNDVAQVIDPSRFTDASCGGATTADLTGPQVLGGGLQTAPPQFDALAGDDALVTLGIGGNDAGLIGVAEECASIDLLRPFGAACQQHYDASGSDPNVAAIAAAGPKVAAAIQGIHQRAPQARVLVVGYPDGLPVNGTACWPVVPISRGDVRYFDSLETSLNSVLQSESSQNGATFVDTFDPSIGHDACQPAGTAWINGIIPTSPGFPLHPNRAGEQSMADQVLAALGDG